MDRIGVRELRQNASRYLSQVAAGKVIEVTDRGRPVARIVPIRNDAWQDLIARGRVTPATDDTDVADEAPRDYAVDASAILLEMRAE